MRLVQRAKARSRVVIGWTPIHIISDVTVFYATNYIAHKQHYNKYSKYSYGTYYG